MLARPVLHACPRLARVSCRCPWAAGAACTAAACIQSCMGAPPLRPAQAGVRHLSSQPTQAGTNPHEILDTTAQEVTMLAGVRHPCVVALHGACLRPPAIFLVEERMAGTLGALLHGPGGPGLPVKQVRFQNA